MRDYIMQSFQDVYALDINVIILSNIIAVLFSLFIMFSYKITYAGTAYSRRFNVTLGMLTILTTLIMSVISSNIALSLGMVGALSIIRFRTAVKDMRDAGYIFWCIAAGIACGAEQYTLGAISSVILFIFMIVFKQIGPDNKLLLIVRSNIDAQHKIEASIMQHFGEAAKPRMKNASEKDCEVVYQVTQSALKRSNERAKADIVQRLMSIEGVQNVNMVEQSDDISR
jgi:uncharacterized membrane protein YhiD involved in acid resistance